MRPENQTVFTSIRNWIRKRRGQHVCEEFTRWRVRRAYRQTSFPWDSDFHERRSNAREAVSDGVYNVQWQERECTICGKVQREELPLF
jgi:hypothetical protein